MAVSWTFWEQTVNLDIFMYLSFWFFPFKVCSVFLIILENFYVVLLKLDFLNVLRNQLNERAKEIF